MHHARKLAFVALIAAAGGAVACGGDGGGSGGGGSGGGSTTSTTSTTTTTTTGTNTVTLGEGECRDVADCEQGVAYCEVPGADFCGGDGCGLEPCGLDSDCIFVDTPFVCEISLCCGDKRCVPGCNVDADCVEGEACTPDLHCVPQPCDAAPCPENFDCGMGAVPSCARRGCAFDSDCDGYCVLGDCYATPGKCELPKP